MDTTNVITLSSYMSVNMAKLQRACDTQEPIRFDPNFELTVLIRLSTHCVNR